MVDDAVEMGEKKGGMGGSKFGRVLRLVPITTILLVSLVLFVMLLLGGLVKITAWYLLQFILPILGLVFLVVVLGYALIRRRLSKLVILTGLVSLLALAPALMLVSSLPYPASLEATMPAATVRLPADVPLKVAWGGDSLESNYHAVTPDQRWAYDLVVAPYFLENAAVEDYGCYGVPVVAPAAGIITAAHDGDPMPNGGIRVEGEEVFADGAVIQHIGEPGR